MAACLPLISSTNRTAPPSTVSAFTSPALVSGSPLIGSVTVFSAANTSSRRSVICGSTFNLAGHHMLEVDTVNRQDHAGLVFFAFGVAGCAECFFDLLL